MAITQTILGPNSAKLTWKATDTTAQIMTAMDAYITAHGWELFDNAAPVSAITGTNPVGRVYRALQDGSTTVYKYVQIGMTSTNISFKIWESWNATTHVGTNEGSYLNNSSAAAVNTYGNNPFPATTDNTSIVLFVNQKWLAFRVQLNTLVYQPMYGAFEIKKDFGEDPAFPTNIFMSNVTSVSYPSSNNYHGFYGSPRSSNNPAIGNPQVTNNNSIMTAIGGPVGSSNSFSNILPAALPNATVTMVATEMTGPTLSSVAKLRGRIFGIKLIYGAQVWNDMDQIQVMVDNELFQNTTGSLVTHHALVWSHASYIRFALPL